MKKSITREQIIDTALDLMRDKKDLQSLNLREIARVLGCAHTNIYNYFSSYTALLWAVHTALQEIFIEILRDNLSEVTSADIKLHHYFDTFLQMYLDNKGWFRLVWLEYIGDERPQSNQTVTQNVRSELNHYAADIWQEISGITPDASVIDQVIHMVHCYIVGEVSNYISGRRLIEKEKTLKEHVVNQAVYIFTLYMKGDMI